MVSSDFAVTVEAGSRACIVGVAGQLDVATAPILHAALVDALGQGLRQLVLDLSETAFIDSSGLSVVVALRRLTRSAGVVFSVVVTRPGVRRLFALTGLDRAVALHTSVETALADQQALS